MIKFIWLIPNLLIKPIKVLIAASFERWLARRNPPQFQHQLSSRNIMIYPSRFGLAYLVVVVMVFLLGTNYQNNIILLLSYLLASLFISVMLHSFYNFSQLTFSSAAQQTGYVDQTIYYPVYVNTTKVSFDINAFFTECGLQTTAGKIKQCQKGTNVLTLNYKPISRGQHSLGRVTVFSEFSLGLFISKSILDFEHFAIVYPQPKTLVLPESLNIKGREDVSATSLSGSLQGNDEFFELKPFILGDSRAKTAWKQLAKGQGKFSKQYHQYQSSEIRLAFHEMPGQSVETKLSYLSFLVSELTKTNQKFGLSFAKGAEEHYLDIEPNTGLKHQQSCLTALALY